MAVANLRWEADTKEAQLAILMLKGAIKSIEGESSKSLGSASGDFKKVGSDAEKAGRDTKLAWRDAKTGLLDLDRAASKVNRTMSGGPFGLFDAIGNVGYAVLKMGAGAQKATSDLGQMASAGGSAGGIMGSLGTALGGLAPILGPLVGLLGTLAAALLVLPALVAAVTFVAVALLDVITTLTAVVAGFVAPLTLVTGLLGGLGAAFAYVAAQSFKNKVSTTEMHDALLAVHVAQQTYNADLAKYGAAATQTEGALIALHKAQDKLEASQQGVALGNLDLTDKFHKFVATLSKDFAPYILALGQAASTALTYLGQIAKLPLDQAFKNLATHGVKLFSQFLYGVANVLKKPFRLAIAIAFGSSGSTMQKSVQSWWDSFSNYLFGYTKTKQIELAPGKFGFSRTTVAGALQPIVDWFDQQHFVDTGIKWSEEIISGLKHSKEFMGAITQIAKHAGTVAGDAFNAVFVAEVKLIFTPGGPIDSAFGSLIRSLYRSVVRFGARANAYINAAFGHAWDWVRSKAIAIWNAITGAVRDASHRVGAAITGAIGGALSAIVGKVRSIGGAFAGWIGNILSSIPGLQTVLGLLHQVAAIVGANSGPGPLFSGKGHGGARGAPVTATGGIFRTPQVRTIAEAGAEAVIPLTGAAGRSALAVMGGGAPIFGDGAFRGANFYGAPTDAAAKLWAKALEPHITRIIARRA